MKILWVSHFVPYPPAGGALQRSYHLLRSAAEQHEVHLFALHQPRLLPTDAGLRESVEALSRLCASVRVFPIPAERSALHRQLARVMSVLGSHPFDVTWLRSPELANAIARFQGDRTIDLVHADTIGLWQYVSAFKTAPVVLGHHNIESDLILRRVAKEGSSWRARLFSRDALRLRELEARAASVAATNLVVSALDGTRLSEIAPSAVVNVVDNGVDTEYWTPSAAPGKGIIFAGTLGWYPNRDAVEFLLADVWPALLAKAADRKLVLVGRDPPPVALSAASDPRVEVTGFVPDVRPFMRASKISVCPMRVGGGTRLKILDSLAMALPLVSTSIGVEGLDLVENEHYLRAESGAEFVAQIDRLEQDAVLCKRLGDAGRKLAVERYDWRVIGRQLDTAYARAIGRRVSEQASA